MSGKVFLDTNLWVYLHGGDAKGQLVRSLVDLRFLDITISSQVLGELYQVLTRKKIMDVVSARDVIANLRGSFVVLPIQPDDCLRAVDISMMYGYSYWDSLIVVSALSSGCNTLFSEDMHHGQVIDKRLTILNPFVRSDS